MLWTDVVTPAELTGYARAALEDYERNKGTLARWLPNRDVADIVARFSVGATGLQPVAEYRSYDAETPIGSLPGGKRVTIELPPVGLKYRVSEYDQLRARGADSDEQVLTSIERATTRVVGAVIDRVELERGRALETAALNINENGFMQTGTWSRDAGNTVTAAVLWSSSATAKPLDDITLWRDVYVAANGEQPGAMVVSTKVFAALSRTAEFRSLAATTAGTPSLVSQAAVQDVLLAHGLPAIVAYDRQVKVGAAGASKVLSDNKVFMLPAPVDPFDAEGTDLGGTFWGQTLEASESDYGIEAGDQPGIVVGTWKTRDPIAVWVHSAAISLPVLANSNLSLVATVL
ncbi:major capsid protein [Rhodococcus sp. 1168]|uniref:major capsid protein n=1 Tax=Rhodococcus sp. 1168 TaxID=2018041 RepID=UPI000A0D6CF1|nr:major capsid protein [Rhodococcus sp. 1168]ORI13437.1 major capsid protein E [Rhodococcus sp. 1168]